VHLCLGGAFHLPARGKGERRCVHVGLQPPWLGGRWSGGGEVAEGQQVVSAHRARAGDVRCTRDHARATPSELPGVKPSGCASGCFTLGVWSMRTVHAQGLEDRRCRHMIGEASL
jgi:hypothetical protein